MGFGGMVVMDDSTSMVKVAKFYTDFVARSPVVNVSPVAREQYKCLNYLPKLLTGKSDIHDLENLEHLCQMVKETSLCGLGQSAPNPILSTLQYFKEEYLALLQETKHPVSV
jgi:bidirectional [NiFe] hydrogenase diaphorase subunit